ncbi:MAG: hypothetical protein CMG14_04195 [Candidatus Marinimicrobia bacterium]|nr:hypothetical protein [Candidatus Neomarinimicrobiota bacterium]
MISHIISFILKIIFNVIFFTCKWEIMNDDLLNKNKNKPLLICIWHSRLIFFPRFFKYIKYPVWGISSTHKDSEILARVLKSWGINLIKGSSTRGWINVIKQMSKLFKEENATIIVTADGPKGPRKVAKEGSIKLAKKHNVPIVAASAISSSYWELPSWDQTKIPKPFSTIYVKFDEHYFNNDQINSKNISKYIDDNQNQLTKEIDKNI